jgi:hypothetical protein
MDSEHLSEEGGLKRYSGNGLTGPGFYRVWVKGCLDASWSAWWDGMQVIPDYERGETVLAGELADQAALHGVLAKVRNLGLVLLQVTREEPAPDGPGS